MTNSHNQMRAPVAGIVAVTLPLVLGLAACSSGGGSTSSGSGAGIHAQNGKGDLPSDFPLPSDVSAVQSATIGSRISVTMRLGDSMSDYDFWVGKLPQAGYTIGQNDKTPDGGLLSFSGNGFRNGTLAVRTGAASIAMTK